MPYRISFLLLFVIAGMQSAMVNAAQIQLNVADIVSPTFSARAIRVTLLQNGSADLHIAEVHVAGKIWNKVHLHCADFSLSTEKIVCRKGRLDAAPDLPFSVSYVFDTQKLDLRLAAGVNEWWRLHADFHARPWHVSALLRNAQASRLAVLLPASFPLPTKGVLNGTLELLGNKQGLHSASADIQLADLAFSDSSGLRAGEKIGAKLHLDATHMVKNWDGLITLDWGSGELFWQPLYLRGGHRLQAQVQWDGTQIRLAQASIDVDGVGKVALDALWDVAAKQLLAVNANGSNLGLARFFSDYAKPFLAGGLMAESEMSGTADFSWAFSKGATQELRLNLHEAALVDEKNTLLCMA